MVDHANLQNRKAQRYTEAQSWRLIRPKTIPPWGKADLRLTQQEGAALRLPADPAKLRKVPVPV